MLAMSAPCSGESRTGPKPAAVVASSKGSSEKRAGDGSTGQANGMGALKRKRWASLRRSSVERSRPASFAKTTLALFPSAEASERHIRSRRGLSVRSAFWMRCRPPWKQTSSSGDIPFSSKAALVTILKTLAAGAMGWRAMWVRGPFSTCSAIASTRPVLGSSSTTAPIGTR